MLRAPVSEVPGGPTHQAGGPLAPAVSVVVRAKDEAESIGRLLDELDGQRVEGGAVEVIVVDSGSRDGTPDIARDRVAEMIEIPASAFSFGRALNLGAAAAGAPIIVALSAHAFPYDERWLARVLAHFEDERVACVTGAIEGPDNEPLRVPVYQDRAMANVNPFWGYSNAAGAFRADLWRQRPFREDMPGTEDKEWAWHWLSLDHVVVLAPDVTVEHAHARDPLGDCYRRARREWEGFASYLDLEPVTARDMARIWWADQGRHASRWRARRDPWRAAALLGQWAGRRRGRP
jgi:rhamnosyltransferase